MKLLFKDGAYVVEPMTNVEEAELRQYVGRSVNLAPEPYLATKSLAGRRSRSKGAKAR